MAGVMFDAASTATEDIDILVDDRNRSKLVTGEDEQPSLTGLIQRKVDKSFRTRGQPLKGLARRFPAFFSQPF